MRRVLIVGDSLFAEALAHVLASDGAVEVVGHAPTSEAALSLLAARQVDAVIVAGVGEGEAWAQLVTVQLDLPLIRADLNADSVQVVTSQRIVARSAELIEAIRKLPARQSKSDA